MESRVFIPASLAPNFSQSSLTTARVCWEQRVLLL